MTRYIKSRYFLYIYYYCLNYCLKIKLDINKKRGKKKKTNTINLEVLYENY